MLATSKYTSSSLVLTLFSFSSNYLDDVETQRSTTKRGTGFRRNRHRRQQPRSDSTSLQHTRRSMESLRCGSSHPTKLESSKHRPLHPVRYLRPKRRRIQALIFNRRHSRLLCLLGQKAHGGPKLPSERCHVEERSTRRHPECSQSPPRVTPDRHQALPRTLRTVRKDRGRP